MKIQYLKIIILNADGLVLGLYSGKELCYGPVRAWWELCLALEALFCYGAFESLMRALISKL